MIAVSILLVSLGLDTFAVAVGVGLSGLPRAQWRRVGLVFACCEGLMPVIGLCVGRPLSGRWAGYAAAGLLILVGLRAIKEALTDDDNDNDEQAQKPSLLEGKQLLLTGLSVSLDELAVGFSLGVSHVAFAPTLAYIALQAFVITLLGLSVGVRLGARLEDRAELVSGIVLTLLGIALLINQVTGSHFF